MNFNTIKKTNKLNMLEKLFQTNLKTRLIAHGYCLFYKPTHRINNSFLTLVSILYSQSPIVCQQVNF